VVADYGAWTLLDTDGGEIALRHAQQPLKRHTVVDELGCVSADIMSVQKRAELVVCRQIAFARRQIVQPL